MGELIYTPREGYGDRRTVKDGIWLCEVALWCHWSHSGQAVASSHCELVVIHVQEALKAIAENAMIFDIARMYALIFHSRIASNDNVQPPDDITVPFTDFGEIVFSMPMEVRRFIGAVALREIDMDISDCALGAEVDNGKAVIIQRGTGDVERVVALAVLQIQRFDGCCLVRLGHWNSDGEVKPSGKLPGAKVGVGELPSAIVDRLLRTELAAIKHMLTFAGINQEVHSERSRRHGVPTKYLRTVQQAQFVRATECTQPTLCGNRRPTYKLMGSSGSLLVLAQFLPRQGLDFNLQDCLIISGEDGMDRFYVWLPVDDVKNLNMDVVLGWLERAKHEDMYGSIEHFKYPRSTTTASL